MQTTACPACGAQVTFRSAASALCVCSYCQSTVLKDAEAVKDLGKMSAVLEDFSPLQMGASGKYQDKAFTLIGRIQLRYDNGVWNEWYCWFDDGSTGWLSDASGEYVITFDRGEWAAAPGFETLAPLARLQYDGKEFVATDVRLARCTGAQGELPFRVVGEGWQARVADFRCQGEFLTLDYSGGAAPHVYAGKTVGLWALAMQGLRSQDEIESEGGRYRGKASPLDCPSCGGSISYRPGIASHVVCPSCQASVDCTGERELVFEAAKTLAKFENKAAFNLGDTGAIKGVRYEVIGILERQTVGAAPPETWMEYLLQSHGILRWLVHFEGRWFFTEAVAEWPQYFAHSTRFRDQDFLRESDYQAVTLCAVGAFNWRVCAGDTQRVVEYAKGEVRLAFEIDSHEATCSLTRPMSGAQLAQAFGASGAAFEADEDEAIALPRGGGSALLNRRDASLMTTAYLAVAFIVFMLRDHSFAGFFSSLLIVPFVVMLLWLPMWCFDVGGDESALDAVAETASTVLGPLGSPDSAAKVGGTVLDMFGGLGDD